MRSKFKAVLAPVMLATSFFMAGNALARGQQSSSPSNATSQSAAPKSGQRDKSSQGKAAAKSDSGNDFPLAQSEAAAKANTQNASQQNSQSAQPERSSTSPHPEGKKSATSKDNPFPEAQSEAAAKGGKQEGDTAPANAASSSASSGGYSSSNAHLPPPELGQGKLPSHEKMDTFTRDHTEDGRIEDDLNVADLYMKNGNYRGSLLRYQDALQYDPQNDVAAFGVAESLCKENRTAEAMAHFKSYAKANPQGRYALKAEKMLAHPNKCTHNF